MITALLLNKIVLSYCAIFPVFLLYYYLTFNIRGYSISYAHMTDGGWVRGPEPITPELDMSISVHVSVVPIKY